jgi:hypothetical protein
MLEQMIESAMDAKRLRIAKRRPVKCPQSVPMLNLVGMYPGVHVLRYADINSPDSPRKATGAASLYVYLGLSTGPLGFEQTRFWRACTRNPIEVRFDSEHDGLLATYFSRWASQTGEVGPWSLPVIMRVAA